MCENLYDVRYIPEAKTIKELQVSKVLNLTNCTGKPRVFSNVPGVHCLNKSCNIDEVGATLVCLSVCLYMHACLSVCLSVYTYLSVCLSVCLYIHACLSVCLSVYTYLSVCLSSVHACQSVCLSIHACVYLPVCPYMPVCTCLSVLCLSVFHFVHACLSFSPSACLFVSLACITLVCENCFTSCFFRFPSLISGLIGSNPNPINKINTK